VNVTNLVLLAILPHFNEFARKLDLSMPLPVTTNEVKVIHVGNTYPSLRASVVFQNGHVFDFESGHITWYRSPYSADASFGRADLKRSTYAFNVSEEEATIRARQCAQALGSSLEELYMDLAPEISIDSSYPRYMFTWYRPNSMGSPAVEVEIDAVSNTVVECFAPLLIQIHGPEPQVPGLDVLAQQSRIHQLAEIPGLEVKDLSLSDERITVILARIKEWIDTLRLPCPIPESIEDVKRAQLSYMSVRETINIQLTSEYRFAYDTATGVVVGMDDGRPFFSGKPVRVRDYVGTWRISETAAADLVREATRKLGVDVGALLERPPRVERPSIRGEIVVPRFSLEWKDVRNG
jgi:hypothetical protein